MSFSQLWKKIPPGPKFVVSLLFNWKLFSLPLILSGVFKSNFWQTILIFSISLPFSVAALVCLRNYRQAKKEKELGAESPPSVPSKVFGGLDVVKDLRWEYRFGHLGDSPFRYQEFAIG